MFSVLFCFIIPLLAYIKIPLIGEVSLTEIILIVVGLCNVGKYAIMWKDKRLRLVVRLGAAWLLMAVISDIYRNTPMEDFLRGWARIVVLIGSVFAVGALVWDDRRKISAFAMGHLLSISLYAILYGTDLPFYKFIVGFAVSGAAFIISAWTENANSLFARMVPLFAGVLALVNNARSLAGITLIAGVYPLLYYRNEIVKKINSLKVILPIAIMILAGLGVLFVYKTTAASGMLGEEALQKYTDQLSAETGDFSIFEGRGEVFFAWPKIMQSPVIGWGSWAKDIVYVEGRRSELGLKVTGGDREVPGLIPAHSHFFGAWLEAGIVGAIFWFVIWCMVIKVLLSNATSFMGNYRGIGVFILIFFSWDILFSPFGGERRVFNGFIIWLIVVALNHADRAASRGENVRPQASNKTVVC